MDVTIWSCTRNKSGTWSCVQSAREQPPPDLKNALKDAKSLSTETGASAVTGGEMTGDNNTNTMNGDFLKGGDTLKNGGIDNNVPVPTNSNDTSQ